MNVNIKVTGVTFNKYSKRWVAMIRHNNKLYRLGTFKDKKDAIRRRKVAEFVLWGEIQSIQDLYEQQDDD